jgi:hypothetical protein
MQVLETFCDLCKTRINDGGIGVDWSAGELVEIPQSQASIHVCDVCVRGIAMIYERNKSDGSPA